MGANVEEKVEAVASAASKNLAGSASGTVQLDRPKQVNVPVYTYTIFMDFCLEVPAYPGRPPHER